MNTDIQNYIDYIFKANNGKRKKTQSDTTEILNDLTESSMLILMYLAQQVPTMKGRELTKMLTTMKHDMCESINMIKKDELKKDAVNKKLDKMIFLASVAINIRCVELIDEISEYSQKNHHKTFEECINGIRMNHSTNNKSFAIKIQIPNPKKAKTCNTKKVEKEVVYEEESEYESSDEDNDDGEDDGEDDDDDDDDDEYDDEETEEDRANNKMLNNKENQEFIKHIYKGREENPEIQILNYYTKLPLSERKDALSTIKEIKEYQTADKPIIFKIMEMPLSVSQRNHVLKNYSNLASSRFPDNKLRNWFDSLMTIPFGKYKGVSLDSIKSNKVKDFLDNLQNVMDNAVYGHDEAKRQIIQMMGQQVRNPKSKGNMLGIWGPPGNGKTTLIKEGIAKAMDKPFVFISLGGATDASFLEGHSFTYEGSIYGRIMNGLISSKCMDPIIYFDELDKISKSHKGEEITNILVHLTDPAQNSQFRDKYFHGVDIDLSRATMIFSFNDPSEVNPILLDRITTVETKYLMTNQKMHIATNYLIPDMMKEMGLNQDDVTIDENTLRDIISNYTHEGGVRKLKSLLYNIIRELNIANMLKATIDNVKVKFPFKVEKRHLKELLKDKMEIEPEKIHTEDKTGIINGMYASSGSGTGGVLPIEVLWIPSSNALEIKATGNLQQVIKESTMVASTLAFNHISKELRDKYLTEWKDNPMGFHLHCPDGSTPKDGPSAGTALTVSIISMLTDRKIKHDLAITGEINLQGKVTAIGGLEAKLEGAKRAGITVALYPKENEKDIKKIKERNPTLLDKNFKAIAIETLDEAIKYALI